MWISVDGNAGKIDEHIRPGCHGVASNVFGALDVGVHYSMGRVALVNPGRTVDHGVDLVGEATGRNRNGKIMASVMLMVDRSARSRVDLVPR